MKLSGLPADIISVITSFLNGHHIAKLWKSGDSWLLTLLAAGVTSMEVNMTTRSDAVVWPRLSAYLPKLRSISVSFESLLSHLYITDFDWSLVPSTLVELEVQILIQPLTVVLPSLRKLRILYPYFQNARDLYNAKVAGKATGEWADAPLIPNFAHFTPHLTSLTCGLPGLGLGPEVSYPSPQQLLALDRLPPSLTELEGQFRRIFTQPSIDRQDHPAEGEDAKVAPDSRFPPNLMTLKIYVAFRDIVQFIHNLPASMRHLHLSTHQDPDFATLDWSFAHLPSLVSLSLPPERVTVEQLSQLPRQLTQLDFPRGLYAVDQTSCFKALPPSLTSLHMHHFNLKDAEKALLIPRALERAHRSLEIVAPSAYQGLPPHFKGKVNTCCVPSWCKTLELEEMNLFQLDQDSDGEVPYYGYDNENDEDDYEEEEEEEKDIFGAKQGGKLSLLHYSEEEDCEFEEDEEIDYHDIYAIDDDDDDSAPVTWSRDGLFGRKPRSQAIHRVVGDSDAMERARVQPGGIWSQNLPRGLKRLRNVPVLNSTALKDLPDQLEELSCISLHHGPKDRLPSGLTSFSGRYNSSGLFCLSPSQLPRNLRSLNLCGAEIKKNTWFTNFPLTLTTLQLKDVKGISPTMIAPLHDSNLSTLVLHLKDDLCHRRLGDMVAYLPRGLLIWTVMFVKSPKTDSGLTDIHMARLPRSLVRIQLPPSSQITAEGTSHLNPFMFPIEYK